MTGTPPEVLMVKHARMVERIAQWMVKTGQLRGRDFEEACSLGKIGLAEAARSYDPERGGETTHFWIRICGAIKTGLRRERHYRRHMLASGLMAAGDYWGGRRPADEVTALTPERALLELQKVALGLTTALALGHLGGIWNLDAETQIAARAEHARALEALQMELGRLPDRDQRLLRLRYTERAAWPTIAGLFEVSLSTIDRWHAEAIGRLAKALKRRDIQQPPPRLDAR